MWFHTVPVPTNHLMKTPSSLLSCVRKQKEFLTFCSPGKEICPQEIELKHRGHFTSLVQEVSQDCWKLLRTAGPWDVSEARGPWTRWGWPEDDQRMTQVIYCCRVWLWQCDAGRTLSCGMAGEVGGTEVTVPHHWWMKSCWTPTGTECFHFIQNTPSWRRSLGTISCSGIQGRLE